MCVCVRAFIFNFFFVSLTYILWLPQSYFIVLFIFQFFQFYISKYPHFHFALLLFKTISATSSLFHVCVIYLDREGGCSGHIGWWRMYSGGQESSSERSISSSGTWQTLGKGSSIPYVLNFYYLVGMSGLLCFKPLYLVICITLEVPVALKSLQSALPKIDPFPNLFFVLICL